MKVRAHGPYSVHRPDGMLWSPMPGEELEVSDSNNAMVEFLKGLAESGHVTVLDEPQVSQKPDPVPIPEESIPALPAPEPKKPSIRRK